MHATGINPARLLYRSRIKRNDRIDRRIDFPNALDSSTSGSFGGALGVACQARCYKKNGSERDKKRKDECALPGFGGLFGYPKLQKGCPSAKAASFKRKAAMTRMTALTFFI